MPIFCVSDLHLCDRGFRDNFAVEGREARFYKFLDYVEAEGGQLYVLGDLFDWWQANLSKSIFAYRDLLARLAHMGPVGALWIAGNHDNALTDFIGSEIKLRGLELPAMSKAFEATIGGTAVRLPSRPRVRSLLPGRQPRQRRDYRDHFRAVGGPQPRAVRPPAVMPWKTSSSARWKGP